MNDAGTAAMSFDANIKLRERRYKSGWSKHRLVELVGNLQPHIIRNISDRAAKVTFICAAHTRRSLNHVAT